MNVQVLADPAGRLIWASPALPGARHDMGAATEHGLIAALTRAGVQVVADNGYHGAGLDRLSAPAAPGATRERPASACT